MHTKSFASAIVALAALAAAGSFAPAQARYGGHSWGGSAHAWAPHSSHANSYVGMRHDAFHRFHHHHHRRHVFIVGYPYVYDDGCYWLKRRAIYTGSPYWWRRYYACQNDYY